MALGTKESEGLPIGIEDGKSPAGAGSQSLWWTVERAEAEELR